LKKQRLACSEGLTQWMK